MLFDTNVVLDVLLDRAPFAEVGANLFSRVERGDLTGFVGATTVTTVHYLSSKVVGAARAHDVVDQLLSLFGVAAVNRTVLVDALQLSFEDYEDAVLHEAARHAGAEGVVTRDRRGFRKAKLAVYAPEELLKMLDALGRHDS